MSEASSSIAFSEAESLSSDFQLHSRADEQYQMTKENMQLKSVVSLSDASGRALSRAVQATKEYSARPTFNDHCKEVQLDFNINKVELDSPGRYIGRQIYKRD